MHSAAQVKMGFVSKDLNAGFMDLALAMDLYNKGLPIAMLMFTHRAGSRVIVPPHVKKLSDLQEKSVLIPHRLSVEHMLVHRLLTAGKLNITSVEQAPHPLMPEMASADHDNEIGAFICPAPFGENEIKTRGFRSLLISRDLWKDHPGTVFVVHKDLIDTQFESLGLMVKCLVDSARQLDMYRLSLDAGSNKIENAAALFLNLAAHQVKKVIKTSGISYAPQRLVPDMQIIEIVRDYMGTTMQIMPEFCDLAGFIMPEFILTALSEHTSFEN